jgi:hypothetical protein
MKRRALIAVAAIVAAVVLGVGAVFAYFEATGHGTGSASDGTAPTITIQAVASGSPTSTLLPGSTADLLVQVQNPSSFTLTIVGIAQNGTATPEGGSGCTSSNDGVSVPAETGLSMSLAPGTSVLHFSGAAAMSLTSYSGCQGASFDIPVTLTVQQP